MIISETHIFPIVITPIQSDLKVAIIPSLFKMTNGWNTKRHPRHGGKLNPDSDTIKECEPAVVIMVSKTTGTKMDQMSWTYTNTSRRSK